MYRRSIISIPISAPYLSHGDDWNWTSLIQSKYDWRNLASICLVVLWLVSGRAGEIATTSWNLARWIKKYGFLFLDWSQIKTGKQKGVGLLPDAEVFSIWIYHCLACALASGFLQDDPTEDNENWLIPQFIPQFIRNVLQAGSRQFYSGSVANGGGCYCLVLMKNTTVLHCICALCKIKRCISLLL